MRSTNFEKVGDFQREVLGNSFPSAPRMPPDPMHELRCLQEELYELAAAIQQQGIVDAADAVIDLIYFAYGLGFKMGLPMDDVFDIVHQANLAKIKGRGKRGHDEDAIKPADWVDPKTLIARRLRP